MCILISLNEENGWERWKPEHCSRHCYQKNQALKNKGAGSFFTLYTSRLSSENTNSDAWGTSSVWFVCLFWCGKLRVNTCRGSNADPQRFHVCEEYFLSFKDLFVFLFMCTCLFLYMGMRTWLQCPQRPEGGVRHPRAGVHKGCETPSLWVWWTHTLWMCNGLFLRLKHFSGSCQNLDT